MGEQIIRCIVAKPDLKIWDGKGYLKPKIGQEIELPKNIARLEARNGFIRMIVPK